MNLLTPQTALSLAVLIFALLAAIFDVQSHRIPNLLTGSAMLIGLLLHMVMGGWRDMLSACGALLLCGGVFLIVYFAGGMGAGDVKLIAAEGALLGLSNVAPLLTITAIAGGVLALIYAGMHGRLKQTCMNVWTLISHHRANGFESHPEFNLQSQTALRLPYALAIGFGSIATLGLEASQRHLG